LIQTLRDLWRYRELAAILVGKELKLRYRRSVLGFAWTMLNPLLTMIILTMVFSHVWRIQVEKYPVFVLSALLAWNFFAQSVSGGAPCMVHNESLLRNIYVPRAIFPLALVLSHLVNFLLALVPLLLVMFWQGVVPPLSIACVPLCLVILWLFTTGIVLALAAWTVFFRDIGQIVEVSLQALFYLTPIIYPLSILPERFLWIVKLNPLLHQVTVFRRVFFEGAWPEPSYFLIAGGCAIVSFAVGLAIFRRQESQFLLYLS
jgi:ABC-2 type transport system permease protein